MAFISYQPSGRLEATAGDHVVFVADARVDDGTDISGLVEWFIERSPRHASRASLGRGREMAFVVDLVGEWRISAEVIDLATQMTVRAPNTTIMVREQPLSFQATLPFSYYTPTLSWDVVNEGPGTGVLTIEANVYDQGTLLIDTGGFPSQHTLPPGGRATVTWGFFHTNSWGVAGRPLEVIAILRGGPSWDQLYEVARARGSVLLSLEAPGQQPAAFSIGQPVQIILGSGVGTRGLIADLFYDPDDERWNYILEEAEVEPGTGQLAGTGRLLQGLWPEFVLQAL